MVAALDPGLGRIEHPYRPASIDLRGRPGPAPALRVGRRPRPLDPGEPDGQVPAPDGTPNWAGRSADKPLELVLEVESQPSGAGGKVA